MMQPARRWLALACALAVLVAACGGAAVAPSPAATVSSAPTVGGSPAPMPTRSPDIYNFVADLRSTNEIPPIADAEASCAGQAKITLAVLTDPAYYNVTSGKASFDVTLNFCPATTRITLAHIHQGSATTNGPVKVDTGLVPAQAITFNAGATIKKVDVDVEPAVADDLIRNPGNYYFNVHSAAHGGGVVRGQLVATR